MERNGNEVAHSIPLSHNLSPSPSGMSPKIEGLGLASRYTQFADAISLCKQDATNQVSINLLTVSASRPHPIAVSIRSLKQRQKA